MLVIVSVEDKTEQYYIDEYRVNDWRIVQKGLENLSMLEESIMEDTKSLLYASLATTAPYASLPYAVTVLMDVCVGYVRIGMRIPQITIKHVDSKTKMYINDRCAEVKPYISHQIARRLIAKLATSQTRMPILIHSADDIPFTTRRFSFDSLRDIHSFTPRKKSNTLG